VPISIAFLGRGGQGIVFAGTVLSEIMFNEGYYVSQLQSYGAEVRGGTVIAYVVIDEKPIENPFIESFDIAIVIHEDGLKRWSEHIKRSKVVIVDKDLVKTRYPNMVEASLSEKALENNVYTSLNMVAVGLVLGSGVLKVSEDTISNVLRTRKGYEQNIKAIKLGLNMAENLKDVFIDIKK